MSSGHHAGAHLYVARDSALHRLAPHVKVAGALGFLLAVVLVPRRTWWPLVAAALAVVVLAAVAGVGPRALAARLVIELPFLGFALLMPFFGDGEEVQVLGLTLHAEGIEAGLTLLLKGSIGVGVAVVLAATTTVADLLAGMRRLHVPAAMVLIVHLMLRYGEVLLDEARRMHVARQSRGYQGRWLWQAGAFAAGLGSLFVRSYERGERVQRAMAARGFTGELP